MKPESPLAKRLVDRYGGRKEAAEALDKTPETIRLWLLRGIPLASALDVEERSGGLVTAEEILQEAKSPKGAEQLAAT